MSETDELTREEWRELGFYYEFSKKETAWHLHGTVHGLANLAALLAVYVDDPAHMVKSEHEHYGPYFYLKVTTWDMPIIDDQGIRGTLDDLQRLGKMIETLCANPKSEAVIAESFTGKPSGNIVFHFYSDPFDPAALDPYINRE